MSDHGMVLDRAGLKCRAMAGRESLDAWKMSIVDAFGRVSSGSPAGERLTGVPRPVLIIGLATGLAGERVVGLLGSAPMAGPADGAAGERPAEAAGAVLGAGSAVGKVVLVRPDYEVRRCVSPHVLTSARLHNRASPTTTFPTTEPAPSTAPAASAGLSPAAPSVGPTIGADPRRPTTLSPARPMAGPVISTDRGTPVSLSPAGPANGCAINIGPRAPVGLSLAGPADGPTTSTGPCAFGPPPGGINSSLAGKTGLISTSTSAEQSAPCLLDSLPLLTQSKGIYSAHFPRVQALALP
ncbi:hypothetical protein GUJ93_ZPchr0005g14265 [Zizania palustris]|uniref:Uncharacterized protein n=1 Tax=Zizania palustris TaxID=103762 RepID=A0A8J5ST61_ZIZPA|nr:hypothetical protein GUJ93_ZPchr0005g14265 [Zizania palustris]